jgi:hypothetical protein
MNKYSGLCDLRASAVNIFPLGFDSGVAGFSYGNGFFIRYMNYFAGDIPKFGCDCLGELETLSLEERT